MALSPMKQLQGLEFKLSQVQGNAKVSIDSIVNSISFWDSYIPTSFQGWGAVSNVNFLFRQDGDSLFVSGFFTPGTTVNSQAQVSFPTGLIASKKLSSINSTIVGPAGRSDVGNISIYALAAPGVGYFTFGTQTTTFGAVAPRNAADITNGTGFSFSAVVPLEAT